MNINEYHKMHALERDYWWFQGRRQIVLTVLDELLENRPYPQILDVGCGTGMLLDDLRQRGQAAGLDFSPTALEYCRKRDLTCLMRGDASRLPVESSSVDVITALDLIEHVKEDVLLMSEFFRILKPGGVALMSVPAHKKLWSRHDIALHHFRRYEKSEFRDLVINSGLQVKKYSYSMLTAYIPAYCYRNLQKVLPQREEEMVTDEFPLPRAVNSVLKALVGLEARILRSRSLPIGLSLLCVAAKTAAEE